MFELLNSLYENLPHSKNENIEITVLRTNGKHNVRLVCITDPNMNHKQKIGSNSIKFTHKNEGDTRKPNNNNNKLNKQMNE